MGVIMVSRRVSTLYSTSALIGFAWGANSLHSFQLWFFIGCFCGVYLGLWRMDYKEWNRVRVRRFTRKHRKYVETALEYVQEYREVVAYYIQKSWDHYSGDWEGYVLDILVADDTNIYNSKKRVDFEDEVWEYLDTKFNDIKRRDLFCRTQVNIFHGDNFKIHQKDQNYECYLVLTNKNIKGVVLK